MNAEEQVENAPQTSEELTLEDLQKLLQDFLSRYQRDMQSLNRILSTYEDEISNLKGNFHDLSFRLKQIQATLPPTE